MIRQVAAESNLVLGNSVAFVVPDNLTLWTYHPFVGRGATGNPPVVVLWATTVPAWAGYLINGYDFGLVESGSGLANTAANVQTNPLWSSTARP